MPVPVERDPRVAKQIRKFPADVLADIDRGIATLANYPNIPGLKFLKGSDKGRIRLDVSHDYRIVFRFEDGRIYVEDVQDRKEVYGKKARRARKQRDAEPAVHLRTGPNHLLKEVRALLAQRLREARHLGGLTQVELARAIGRGQSTVSMAEKGVLRVSGQYVRDVMKACGLPEHWPAPRPRRGR